MSGLFAERVPLRELGREVTIRLTKMSRSDPPPGDARLRFDILISCLVREDALGHALGHRQLVSLHLIPPARGLGPEHRVVRDGCGGGYRARGCFAHSITEIGPSINATVSVASCSRRIAL